MSLAPAMPPAIAASLFPNRALLSSSPASLANGQQDAHDAPAPLDRTSAIDHQTRLKDATQLREGIAQRSLILREMFTRIPVPVAAIPKLTGDLEVLRSIEPHTDHPPPDKAT